ncbi:MAG: LysR family transcriptional regulator [Alicyclobacillus sp.]|nr:LysR family transcriptional regulator [Alicyclobacillus sp.]
MTFDQLLAFTSVAQTKNLSLSAKCLHLTQPSVAIRIRNLEEELGTKLFLRLDQQLVLTEAGKKLLQYANQIIALLQQARAEVSQYPIESSVGATPTLAAHYIPHIISQICENQHGLRVTVRQGSSLQLFRQVLEGALDVAFVTHRMEHPDLAVYTLHDELHVVLTAHVTHPIVQFNHVDASVLKAYKLVSAPRHAGFWHMVDLRLQRLGIQFDPTLTVDNIEIAKEVLLEGSFLAFLPLLAIEKEIRNGLLRTVPFQGVTPLTFPIYVICHHATQARFQVQQFLSYLNICQDASTTQGKEVAL